MICGLFSSFDPGILPEYVQKSPLSMKWMMFSVVLFFAMWQIFSFPVGIGAMFQSVSGFILSSIKDSSSSPQKVFLVLFSVFLTLFSMNLWGLVPLFFSLSSHLSVNLSISLSLWGGGIIYSIVKSITFFLSHVVPFGSPPFLWPLLVMVESVSILIRPFTLSIRLMANVMAGHLIMSLMSQSFSSSFLFLPPSLFFMGFFLSFESCISCVQAYVFMSLLSLYWSESEDH